MSESKLLLPFFFLSFFFVKKRCRIYNYRGILHKDSRFFFQVHVDYEQWLGLSLLVTSWL